MAITVDVLTGGSNNHQTTSEAANAIATDFIAEGIVSTVSNTSGVAPATGGFAVNAQGTPDMTVAVSSGVAYVQGTPTSQNSQTFRVKNSASSNVTIAANSSGSTKYDWVYISLNATNLNTPNTAGDNVATLTTSRSSSASTDDGTPPTYGYPLAVVTVANGASSISNSMIRDVRVRAAVSAGASSTSSTWTDTGYVPGTVTYNGNRSYQAVVSGADLTSFLSTGMRLKLTRTTAPPTQSTSLNGTTQYWSRASGSLTGVTFTDDFVVSAWIKVSSYAQGTIVSRFNGTSGWYMEMDSSGRIALYGLNAGAANYRGIISYQSVPLNRWVHVSAQNDMSTFTATTTTSFVMFDGVDVPASVTQGGTNPTTLIQAGNLEIGSKNGGTQLFPGKIAQVAIYSAKVTQATVKASISQTLSGSETSIAGAFKFDGNGNDSSANANNLTANGGATATTTDSPFNSTEYGIITKIAYSTDTTITVQVPEGYAIPTSGGISAMAYSPHKVPFGFPAQRGRWWVTYQSNVNLTQSSATSGTWYNLSTTFNIPIGSWRALYQVFPMATNSTNSGSMYITLSTGSSSESDLSTTSRIYHSTSNITIGSTVSRETSLELSSATNYYLNAKTDVAANNSLNYYGVTSPTVITVEPAHL